MDETQPPSVEELLRQTRWVRSLARHLVHEAADGEDLAQDVWTAAAEKPPRNARNIRGWLARVLANRARSRGRSEARRRRRDLGSADWIQPPATPEEATARVELQRELANAISSLPEPYRHVVYLRYIEDREPAEIARLLGEPAGTIRWRLKEALAKLRARLDEQHGRRSAWVIVLMPMGGSSNRPRWRTPVKLLVIGLSPVVLVIIWLLAVRPAIVQRGRAQTTAALPGGAGRPIRLAFATAADDGCSAVNPLAERLAVLKRTGDPWRDLKDVFSEGRPNPTLEARAASLFDGYLRNVAPGCEHSLSCRGTACELVVLVPVGLENARCQPNADRTIVDLLASETSHSVDSGTPFHDPIKGSSYTRMTLMYRFAREDGTPVPREHRPPVPALAYDFGSPRPRMPADLLETCREAWVRLERQLDALEDRIQDVAPERAFPASTPNAGLTARVVTWVRSVLDRPAGGLPFAVECRAQVCALTPGSKDDPLAIRWQCKPGPENRPKLCFPAPDGGGWYRSLEARIKPFGQLRLTIQDAETKPAYLVARFREGARRESPMAALLSFMDSFPWRGEIAACDRRFPSKGFLRARLDVRGVSGDPTQPSRISLHLGGDLGGTPLATCVSGVIGAASARFEVPSGSDSVTVHSELPFPFDASKVEARLARMRQELEKQRRDPGF
jgi:RNA polymerase sigma factor (sigma-70 family)